MMVVRLISQVVIDWLFQGGVGEGVWGRGGMYYDDGKVSKSSCN